MTAERRISGELARVERRAEGEGGAEVPVIVGYASVFGEWATIYESKSWRFREVVRPGAFAAAIAEKQDVRSLFNHDPNFVLGRTVSGTLKLVETDRGLLQETRPDPDSRTIADLVVRPVARGDVSGQSFAFIVRNGAGVDQTTIEKGDRVVIRRAGERITEYYDGDQLVTERELLSVDLLDVTVATYPAYAGTSAGMRAVATPADFAALEREARSRFAALDGGEAAARSRRARVRLRLAEAE